MKKFEEIKTIFSCNLNNKWAVYGDKEPCVTIESKTIIALLADREQLREALKRLSSSEAFSYAKKTTEEEKMRIDFARAALKKSDEVE